MSYLSRRTQVVQVESKTSKPLEGGEHTVPQGSVLGGLQYVINSNDFPACHQEGESVVHVDDDSDTVSARDPSELRESIEPEAENSANWLRDNRLCVPRNKSKLLVIGTEKLRTSKALNKAKIEVEIIETENENSGEQFSNMVESSLRGQRKLRPCTTTCNEDSNGKDDVKADGEEEPSLFHKWNVVLQIEVLSPCVWKCPGFGKLQRRKLQISKLHC